MKITNRERLMQSPAYWLQNVQLDLFSIAFDKMLGRGVNALAKKLNISKHSARQILRGEYNGTLTEFTEILTQLGYRIKFEKIKNAQNGKQ